jgi:hypothetical protein
MITIQSTIRHCRGISNIISGVDTGHSKLNFVAEKEDAQLFSDDLLSQIIIKKIAL